jgi:hypothetical protein
LLPLADAGSLGPLAGDLHSPFMARAMIVLSMAQSTESCGAGEVFSRDFRMKCTIDNQWLFHCEFCNNGDGLIDKRPADAFGRIDIGRAKA